MEEKKKTYKQIHVDIDMKIYEEFKSLLPEPRMVSIIIRFLIKDYVERNRNKQIDISNIMQGSDI